MVHQLVQAKPTHTHILPHSSLARIQVSNSTNRHQGHEARIGPVTGRHVGEPIHTPYWPILMDALARAIITIII